MLKCFHVKKSFTFKAKIWEWSSKANWYFVSLPKDVSEEIGLLFADYKRGWDSHPVNVKVGGSIWNTSIFPDRETKAFILPLKAAVRKAEEIGRGDEIEVDIEVRS